ncbi:membrane protein [Agromyces luteolus]|uniref:MMPL family transporter n=1 Tax=Agromyces luteolus TaxID=88373 RepID=A0A7C9LGH2_9MICO|nr:MMPL family transporter [Agromyces luteolus]MUN06975.1 MMPL family transporter [Agromyces luteolus]GLK28419.1 membrane protein [Agromyces luteolus]
MNEHAVAKRPGGRVPVWLRALIPAVLILVWFALFGAGGAAFGGLSDVQRNDQASFLPASAEATEVNELQDGFRDSENVPAIVIVASDDGSDLSASQLADIDDLRDDVLDVDGVVSDETSPVIPSDDGEAAQFVASIAPGEGEEGSGATVEAVRALLDESPIEGTTSAVTGPAGFTADLAAAFSGIDGLLLAVALTAVLVILVIVYRSPLLPIIVLFTSVTALTASVFTVVQLAKADLLLLSGQTQGILFILVIGAATDYALLYIARYREALSQHATKWDATWAALKGAWEPIAASAGTVIVGLLILLASELNSNKILGPVAAIGIVFALLAALTLLPALLLWAGRVAFWPRRIARVEQAAPGAEHGRHAAPVDAEEAGERGIWGAVGRLVSRRPRIVWILSTLLLAVMALGLVRLDADGVPSSEFVLGESQARDGQELVSEHFPGGSGTPAVVIGPEEDLQDMADIALDTPGVASVAVLSADSPAGSAPVTEDGVQAFGPPGTPAPDPTVVDGAVLLQATLDDPADSAEAEATVVDLRERLDEVGDDVLVGGQTAVALDTNEAAIADQRLIIPLVLLAILAILMLLLRAVVAPLLLIASVVISFAAALGVSALVFEFVFGFSGADPSVPLFGFVFLVALGVDYNIFLMTRVREETARHGTREGILRGLRLTGGVITSAGLVLAATFAALGVLPILFLAQISFIVAFGVLLDTFLVRTLLVPAVSYDIGRAIWWPSRLSREERRHGVHAAPTDAAGPAPSAGHDREADGDAEPADRVPVEAR